ncbi:MAG TPA: DUF1631 family protein [Dyella sp.]|uniref:DUF1631 family protein n=1 Tax=Dyella sp. TaxID=1869338 RepID=UPI002F946F94
MDVEPQGRLEPFTHERNATSPESGRWPARARRLIGEVHALTLQHLDMALRQCLDELEQQLYAQADRTRNHLDQQLFFDSRLRVQQERARLLKRFLTLIGERYRQMGTSTDSDGRVQDKAPQPLSLLDRDEHEQKAALGKLVARGEARNGPALFELSYRLAVMVAAPPLEGEALPLGPLALTHAFHDATAAMELPIEHRLLMLRSFDQTVIQGLGALYGTVNELLRSQGILRQLRAFPGVRQNVLHRTPSRGTEEPAPPISPLQPPQAQIQAPRDDHIAVLENLRTLLAQGRSASAQGTLGGRIATTDELQLALNAVQRHVSDITDHASRELRSAQRLREELLLHLNTGKPAGAPPTDLSPEQGDTVELMAMLFEQLHRQMRQGSNAQSVLSGLQVPMLRMAVADRNFFDQQEHPARKWLGAVAEAASEWLDTGDSEADRALATQLEQLVARTQREPPSTGLYTSLLADIEHHLAQLARKAQIAERRQVEAMQGRERLEQARRQAAQLIAERFALSPPRGLLRTLLERAWSDVLALTLLRHGQESEAFAERLHITDQLLGHAPTYDRLKLQYDVETGLQQIGMHAEEAEQVAQRLLGAGTDERKDDGPTATGLALKLKQHQRLGETAAAAPAAAAPVPAPTPDIPVDPREQRIYERLLQQPFGSWFEFVDSDTGQISQRKLAWFSPVSGHCLFMTRRGQRGEDMDLHALARALARGAVRELATARETLIDRAWHALTGNLRQWANGDRA